MTSHAQPISAPGRKGSRKPVGAVTDKGDGEGSSLSVAKIGLIGTIGAAIITVTPIAISAFNGSSGGNVSVTPVATPTTSAVATPPPPPTPRGSIDQVAVNATGTAVTVTGSAEKDVDRVIVLVGPRQSGGQYWANSANVVNGQWELVVATEPHVPLPYKTKAYFGGREAGSYYRPREGSAPIQEASYFSLPETGPTPTPTPPPGPLVNCAEQQGDSCFNGPGWGPPSVYQSDH
jgi:hypothetical protein